MALQLSDFESLRILKLSKYLSKKFLGAVSKYELRNSLSLRCLKVDSANIETEHMNNMLMMEDMEAMIYLFGVSHGHYGYLVRNIYI